MAHFAARFGQISVLQWLKNKYALNCVSNRGQRISVNQVNGNVRKWLDQEDNEGYANLYQSHYGACSYLRILYS
jgi:hypothetical protein